MKGTRARRRLCTPPARPGKRSTGTQSLRRGARESAWTVPVAAGGRARGAVELTRGLVQVHAGGPEQVHGRRANLSDEHAGREVVALVEGDGSLPDGLEGEPARGPLESSLVLPAAGRFEVSGEVFDRPGEV